MEIKHLKHFITIADEGNIGRASQLLNISQPPLTRQMQQLEQDIGVPIFKRTAKGVELTDAGKSLYTDAVKILSLSEDATARARSAAEGIVGRLDIGIFGSGIFEVAPRILQRFRYAFPNVQILLHTMNKSEQIEALRQRRISAGFNRLIPKHNDIATKTVTMERVVVGLHSSNPLARRNVLTFQDLVTEPVILFPDAARPNFADFITGQYHQFGLNPNVAQVVGDAATGIALVSSGFGICYVPESATRYAASDVKYVALKGSPPIAIDISCMYLKDDKSPILKVFLGTLEDFRKEIDLNTKK
jgi:DNA-binding transcriptional LysR family regulator